MLPKRLFLNTLIAFYIFLSHSNIKLPAFSQEPVTQPTAPTNLQTPDPRKIQADSQLQQAIEQLQQRQGESALPPLQAVLKLYREIGDRKAEAYTLANLGVAYELLENPAQALDYLQQSLQISRNLQDKALEGDILSSLGRVYLQANNLKDAQTSLSQAINIWEALREGLRDQNKRILFEQQSHTYRTLQKVFIAQNQIGEALEIAERGRARSIADLLAQNLSANSTAKLTSEPLTVAKIQQIAKAQDSTLVEYSIIEDDFKPLIPEPRPLVPDNPESGLDFYLYVNSDEQKKQQPEALYIWVIQPTGDIEFRRVSLKEFWKQDSQSLSEIILATRDAIGVRGRGLGVVSRVEGESSQQSSRQLKQLYQLLIQPIAELLPKNPDAHVTFIPQSSLFLVPFAGLQDENGRYLIEQHTILTAPSIQVLDLTRTARQQLTGNTSDVLVVGNPKMPQFLPVSNVGNPERLTSLPGAEKEANAIATLFKTQPLIGSQATETAVVGRMPAARMIHFATHGLLDNFVTNFVTKPGETIELSDYKEIGTPGAIALSPADENAIALSPPTNDDGFLTTGEILDLKLKAELVVLSACDTGRGDISGDGIVGLSRSFIAVGVPSLVVSLWAVPDAPTASLMTQFYRNLSSNPDKAKALRNAMLTTMKQHPNPIEWAAFTLIGEAD